MRSVPNMDSTLLEGRSAMNNYSSVLRKKDETHRIDFLVIVLWILMIICEMKMSIQSVLTELENAISKERWKNRMCTVKYKVLPSKSPFVKMSTLQYSDSSLGVGKWNLVALRRQTGIKSIFLDEVSHMVEGYDHFRPKQVRILVFPTSIRTYVEDVIRTPNASQVDLMRHEWARYQTYSSFPKTSKVQPIILSRAGFYYTGNQDETVCFLCGLKYKNWKPKDMPEEIHRQMSPDCAFLNGSDGRNVAIERDENDSERHQENKRDDCRQNGECVQVNNGASGCANESFPSTHYQYASDRNHVEGTTRNSGEAKTNKLIEGLSSNVATSEGYCEKRRPPDICNDRAKHPQYAILSNRLASFAGWSGRTNHEPRYLASAGFYYVGTGDCVRCYFCGGGLRSWQNGDDPYVEHARWYPDCDYIHFCRGDDFLRQQSTDNNRSPETCDGQSKGNNPGIIKKELDALRSTAIQSILSMGYSIHKITQAIEIFRMHEASTDFTTEQLLEIILDIEENQGKGASNRNSDQYSSENQRLTNLFQRELDATSSPDLNISSNRNKPCNARLDRHNSSNEIAVADDTESILEENRELKEQMTCKICMDAEACIVFLPCSHMMTCPQCAPAFRKCPICRALVRGTVRAFKS